MCECLSKIHFSITAIIVNYTGVNIDSVFLPVVKLKIILFVFSPVLIKKVNIKEGNPNSGKRKLKQGSNDTRNIFLNCTT